MTRMFCVLAATLAFALPGAATAQDALKRIVQRDQINVGYREDAIPFSFLNAQHQPVGYSMDICQAIVLRVQQEVARPRLRVKFIPVAADQLERVVASGGVDLMCAGTSHTPERRLKMAFSPPIFVSAVKFMVRSKDKLTSAQQLRGKTVAVLGRTTAEPAVNAFGGRGGFALKVARVVSPEAAMSQLALGQADAFARDEVLLLNQQARQARPGDFALLPEALSSEVIAIATPRGDAALQRVVDQSVALLVRGGQMQASYEQWFVKPHPGAPAGLKLPMSDELKAEFTKLR